MCIFSPIQESPFSAVPGALTDIDNEKLISSTPSDCSDCWSIHKIRVGWKRICTPQVLVCLALTLPLGALGQGIDEGEFSQTMLAHKLRRLKKRFEHAEGELLLRSGAESKIKELERVNAKIKCSKAEFRRGEYYPDLLMSDLKKSDAQRGTALLIAGILSAIGASICCVGPLVLLALGLAVRGSAP